MCTSYLSSPLFHGNKTLVGLYRVNLAIHFFAYSLLLHFLVYLFVIPFQDVATAIRIISGKMHLSKARVSYVNTYSVSAMVCEEIDRLYFASSLFSFT
jgi:hypothetical protein